MFTRAELNTIRVRAEIIKVILIQTKRQRHEPEQPHRKLVDRIKVLQIHLPERPRSFRPLIRALKEPTQRTISADRETFLLVRRRALVQFVQPLAADALVAPMAFRLALGHLLLFFGREREEVREGGQEARLQVRGNGVARYLEEALVLAGGAEFGDGARLGLEVPGEVGGDVDYGDIDREGGYHGGRF